MISKKEIKHIATLARIGLSDKEVDKFTAELSAILDWMEDLKSADVSDVSPETFITGKENIAREDREGSFPFKKELRELFPEEKDGYDKVKSVL